MDVAKSPPGIDRRLLLTALLAFGLIVLYGDVILGLVRAWATDSNYSHGFLIPPIAAYMAWLRRDRFFAAPRRPSALGLVVVAVSLIAIAPRIRHVEFLQRLSLVFALAGVVLCFSGWTRLRSVAFPFAILLLMIPLPALAVQQIENPLQIITSQLAEVFIGAYGITVLREGNLLTLTNVTLKVAEECSGFRSVMSLVILGLVFGYVPDSRVWPRLVIALLTIPVVLVANGTRVAVTGIATHYYGRAAAEGFFHDLCGWLAFAAAFATMLLLTRLLLRIAPDPRGSTRAPATAPA
jgi:exosortase